MSKKDKRQPKYISNPPEKHIRAKEDPGMTDHQTPAWQFHRCDKEHYLWGWDKLGAEKHIEIIQQLCSFENMTWQQIKQQAGGKAKGHGTNHHALSTDLFVKQAKDRLQDLKLDDIDELFSLRLGNQIRLYGIRDGRVLRFIWHDPHHGMPDGAYPIKR